MGTLPFLRASPHLPAVLIDSAPTFLSCLQGAQLEPRMGTLPFLRLVTELALTSQLLYIGLALLLRQQLARAAGWALLRSCTVGFSGVLFGLKVSSVHAG